MDVERSYPQEHSGVSCASSRHACAGVDNGRARSQTKVGDFCVTRSAGRSDHPADISLGKVVAFEQQRLARCSSQRVSEDIAEIEASGMASFSESTVRS